MNLHNFTVITFHILSVVWYDDANNTTHVV